MKNKTGIGPKVIVGILMVYLFLPFFITLVYSLTDMWNITVLPESYTLKFYVEMFTSERFWMAIGRSIFISTVSVALAVLVMTPVVFASSAPPRFCGPTAAPTCPWCWCWRARTSCW